MAFELHWCYYDDIGFSHKYFDDLNRENGLYLFFTTNEGQKIFAGVWGYKNNNIELHFLDRIPMGSKLLLTFKKGKRNKETAYLKEVRVVNSIWL